MVAHTYSPSTEKPKEKDPDWDHPGLPSKTLSQETSQQAKKSLDCIQISAHPSAKYLFGSRCLRVLS